MNSSPIADAGSDLSGYTGGAQDAIVFDGTGSHDPDEEPLTFHWDFGDGSEGFGP